MRQNMKKTTSAGVGVLSAVEFNHKSELQFIDHEESREQWITEV